MVEIITILLVAFIVIPEIDLVTNESAKFFAKLVVYSLAFLFVMWLTFFTRVG
jgi:hypothetical protein